MIDLSLHAPTSPNITHRRLAAGKHVPPFIFLLPPPSAPNLQYCKDSDVKVTNQDGKAHLHFSALSGDKKYACELDLCGEIDETESKIARTDRHVTLSLAKSTEGRWGKLVPGKAPQHVKVDWGRWVDSDDEDAMTAGPDLSGMEGLGGMGGGMGGMGGMDMAQLQAMMGGMGGVGGMGGMGGPGGFDMSQFEVMENFGGGEGDSDDEDDEEGEKPSGDGKEMFLEEIS